MSTPTTTTSTTSSTPVPTAMATPLRDGLPTGSGGPIGQGNSGTWSMLQQYQAFLAADPQLMPQPAQTPSGTSAAPEDSTTATATASGS